MLVENQQPEFFFWGCLALRSLMGVFFCINIWLWQVKQWSQTLFSGALWKDKRQWALAHFYLNKRKKLSYGLSAQTLEQVTPTGCGLFILGGIQNSAGQCPEQPAVADIALSRAFGLDHLKRSFPTPTTLWFWVVKKSKRLLEAIEHWLVM